MRHRLAGVALAIAVAAFGVAPSAGFSADGAASDVQARLNRLEAEVTAAEDLSALKKLQRAYGFYLDKGMWEDLQAFFTDDAVANYPAGIYVGHESIKQHLFLNVGGRKGAKGEGDGYVMAIASNYQSMTSDLVIADAQKIEEGIIATVKLPFRLRSGTHTNWFPASDLPPVPPEDEYT